MASTTFKRSVYRILSDLVKTDDVISVDEMDTLDEAVKALGLTDDDRKDSYSLSWADAAACVAAQKPRLKEKVIRMMDVCSLKDGECSREEALLISAMEMVNAGKGSILSLPLDNQPLLSSQILFVDPTPNPRKNDLDDGHEEILARIVEMAGFELVYIPRLAEEFKSFRNEAILKRLLSMINPTLNEHVLTEKVISLQNMDSRFFYQQVLNGKLGMGLEVRRPSWLTRLPGSIVSGRYYANYLCFQAEMDGLKGQLQGFVEELNRRQRAYSVVVNRNNGRSKGFPYGGFHRALLDVMAAERNGPWEVRVYVRAGGHPAPGPSGPGQKFSIEIAKGGISHPVLINGREAAFYLLLLCGSASPQHGVDFSKPKQVQAKYEEAYRLLSNRDDHIPDITLSSTFRPIKTKVLKALEACGITEDLHLFKPTVTEKHTYFIPIDAESVRIVDKDGAIPLADSAIFRACCDLAK